MKTKGYQIVLALLLFFACSGTAFSVLIDFEALGLNSGDAVPSIGVVSFTGSAGKQGSGYAFISNAGDGTGWLPPFDAVGNTFITNPGGLRAAWNMKIIEISFSVPVYDFSFYAADIDSANPTIERLTAKVFDASNNLLGQKSYNETLPWSGDGNVIKFDFPGISGIRRVTITLDNIGSNYDANDIGFGVDNLEFKIVSPPVPITIDIKPGSYPNTINPKSNGKIPVAIISKKDFDAPSQIDQDSLTFGSTGDEDSLAFCNPKGEDINGDGLLDLVCHFYTQEAGFECGDTEGVLKGMTKDGTPIEESDSVRINPCKK